MSARQSLTTFNIGLWAKNEFLLVILPFYCIFGLCTVQKGLYRAILDRGGETPRFLVKNQTTPNFGRISIFCFLNVVL